MIVTVSFETCLKTKWRENATAPLYPDKITLFRRICDCRKGVSALHCAVTNGHVDVLRLLLESGANANIRGQTYQRTPIFMAGEAGNEEMVSLLIHYGAKLNLTDQYGIRTTLALTTLSHFAYIL